MDRLLHPSTACLRGVLYPACGHHQEHAGVFLGCGYSAARNGFLPLVPWGIWRN